MKRGHSNVNTDKMQRWNTPPDCCKLSLGGGATARSWREFPPLALHRDEWEKIGRFMGWTLKRVKSGSCD